MGAVGEACAGGKRGSRGTAAREGLLHEILDVFLEDAPFRTRSGDASDDDTEFACAFAFHLRCSSSRLRKALYRRTAAATTPHVPQGLGPRQQILTEPSHAFLRELGWAVGVGLRPALGDRV